MPERFTTGSGYSLVTGAAALSAGTQSLADKVPELVNGVNALNEGAGKLKDGTSAIVDGVGTLGEGAHELADGVNGSVKFIYKTDAIKEEEE